MENLKITCISQLALIVTALIVTARIITALIVTALCENFEYNHPNKLLRSLWGDIRQAFFSAASWGSQTCTTLLLPTRDFSHWARARYICFPIRKFGHLEIIYVCIWPLLDTITNTAVYYVLYFGRWILRNVTRIFLKFLLLFQSQVFTWVSTKHMCGWFFVFFLKERRIAFASKNI